MVTPREQRKNPSPLGGRSLPRRPVPQTLLDALAAGRRRIGGCGARPTGEEIAVYIGKRRLVDWTGDGGDRELLDLNSETVVRPIAD